MSKNIYAKNKKQLTCLCKQDIICYVNIMKTRCDVEKMLKSNELEIKNLDRNVLMNNLKYLINTYNVKYSDLERKLGLAAGYFSRVFKEDSTQIPVTESLYKISQIFNVGIDSMLNKDLELEERKISLKTKSQSEDRGEKVIRKVCDQTKAGDLEWEKFDLIRDGYTENVDWFYDCFYYANRDENVGHYLSPATGIDADSESEAFMCSMKNNNNIKMLIVKLPCNSVTNEQGYEVYLDTNESTESILMYGSHSTDGQCDCRKMAILNELWENIKIYVSVGKNEAKLNKLYDEILKFDDMPF